ncbi:hypothetical protein GW746_00355, partial [Candidatus Saccharibacteria bacterium]|nr:hypothetical protein [Candidatus Saccharibacteria bacterium]
SNASLAEGARNSAMAGVEDAKRALLRYTQYCQANSEADCAALEQQLTTDVCNEVVRVGNVIGSGDVSGGTATQPGEILVQQSVNEDDTLLDQAYTCVTMKLDTDDYLGSIAPNMTQLVPLIGVADYDRVTVEWFSRDDISSSDPEATVDLLNDTPTNKRMFDSWPTSRPPVMGAQMMQVGESFTLESFDTTTPSGQSNTNTVFLYPTSNGVQTPQAFTARDPRKTTTDSESPAASANSEPLGIRCQATLSAGGYACKATLVLPEPVGGGDDRTAYLRLTSYYGAAHFRVTMQNGGSSSLVQFKAVQPKIDSTGRASDVFKRIETRVDMYNTGLAYPDAAVDLRGGDFCKDFGVTDTEFLEGACTP